MAQRELLEITIAARGGVTEQLEGALVSADGLAEGEDLGRALGRHGIASDGAFGRVRSVVLFSKTRGHWSGVVGCEQLDRLRDPTVHERPGRC